MFGFGGHIHIFTIQGELENTNIRRMNKVIRYSVLIGTTFYLCVMIFGYLSFMGNIPEIFTQRESIP